MNKKELIKALASATNCHKETAENLLEATIATIMATVNAGEDVQILGFGTFKHFRAKARRGRNPQTGEPLQIPAKNYAKFYSSKAWDNQLND